MQNGSTTYIGSGNSYMSADMPTRFALQESERDLIRQKEAEIQGASRSPAINSKNGVSEWCVRRQVFASQSCCLVRSIRKASASSAAAAGVGDTPNIGMTPDSGQEDCSNAKTAHSTHANF